MTTEQEPRTEAGRRYVERMRGNEKAFHAMRPVDAVRSRATPRCVSQARAKRPSRFAAPRAAKVYDIDGSVIPFEGGEHKTADPIVINRLRYFAQKRPVFGIVEVA